MEFLIELLFDLALEGSIEITKSVKVSKWIRYPVIVLVVGFFTAVLGLMFLVSVMFLKENVAGGILFLILTLFMTGSCIYKIRKVYLEYKENKAKASENS